MYGPIAGTYDLATDHSAKWVGAGASHALGHALAVIPDMDGDGDDELALGAPYADSGSLSAPGVVYVLLGT